MCCAAVQNNRTRSRALALKPPTAAVSMGHQRQDPASDAEQTNIFLTDNRAT